MMKNLKKVHIFLSIQNDSKHSRLSNFHIKLLSVKQSDRNHYGFLIPPFSGKRSIAAPLSYAKDAPFGWLHLKARNRMKKFYTENSWKRFFMAPAGCHISFKNHSDNCLILSDEWWNTG